jgi:hypothetical protein
MSRHGGNGLCVYVWLIVYPLASHMNLDQHHPYPIFSPPSRTCPCFAMKRSTATRVALMRLTREASARFSDVTCTTTDKEPKGQNQGYTCREYTVEEVGSCIILQKR